MTYQMWTAYTAIAQRIQSASYEASVMSTLHLIGSGAMDTPWSPGRQIEVKMARGVVRIRLVRTAEIVSKIKKPRRWIRKEAGQMSRAADGFRARRRSDRQDTGKYVMYHNIHGFRINLSM